MTREEEDILDKIIPDESIPINAAIKYTAGDSDIAGENGVDAVTMIAASSDACMLFVFALVFITFSGLCRHYFVKNHFFLGIWLVVLRL